MAFGTTINMSDVGTAFGLANPISISQFSGKTLYNPNGSSYTVPSIGAGNPFRLDYFQNRIYNGNASFTSRSYTGAGTNNSTDTRIKFYTIGTSSQSSTFESTLSVPANGFRNLAPYVILQRTIASGNAAFGSIQIFKNNVLNQTLSRSYNVVGPITLTGSNLNFNNDDRIKIVLTTFGPEGIVIGAEVTCLITTGI